VASGEMASWLNSIAPDSLRVEAYLFSLAISIPPNGRASNSSSTQCLEGFVTFGFLVLSRQTIRNIVGKSAKKMLKTLKLQFRDVFTRSIFQPSLVFCLPNVACKTSSKRFCLPRSCLSYFLIALDCEIGRVNRP